MRYSDRARQAIRLASQEAARLCHDCISSGHLLLGLIRQGEGTAIEILKDAYVDMEKISTELENTMDDKGRGVVIGKLQFSDRAREVLRLAEEESQNMGHKYVGTEHLLIGLILEQEGVAAKALTKFGVELDRARAIALTAEADEEQPSETITFNNVGMITSANTPGTGHPSVDHEKEVLDLEEASQLLRITANDMEELLKTEDMPARMIGGQWRFSRKALIEWLGKGSSRDGRP